MLSSFLLSLTGAVRISVSLMASAKVLGLDCMKGLSSKVLLKLGLGAKQYELLRRSIGGCSGGTTTSFGFGVYIDSTLLLLLVLLLDVGELRAGRCAGHGVLGSMETEPTGLVVVVLAPGAMVLEAAGGVCIVALHDARLRTFRDRGFRLSLSETFPPQVFVGLMKLGIPGGGGGGGM